MLSFFLSLNRSLGLAVPPRIRFLQRKLQQQKKLQDLETPKVARVSESGKYIRSLDSNGSDVEPNGSLNKSGSENEEDPLSFSPGVSNSLNGQRLSRKDVASCGFNFESGMH